MKPSKLKQNQSSSLELEFDRLVFAVSAKLEAGEEVDIDQIAEENPEHADRLRSLLPTLCAMSDLGHICLGADSKSGSPSPHDVHIPTSGLLGDFRILREIGRGGMGVVYEAEQMSLSRRVALKILPLVGVLDNRQLQRFKNEALAAAQLDHPNIVDVLGVGCERSVHYYAMRLIEGRTLGALISLLGGRAGVPASTQTLCLADGNGQEQQECGPPALRNSPCATADSSQPETISLAGSNMSTDDRGEFFRAVARMGAQVATALDFAHQQGIVHRDVKPSNLIIDAAGKAWITDFGLAQIEAVPGLTLTGDVVGTLRYMSPEQALAKRAIVDHRTDVYSLGITLYELATLQPAFPDRNRQELMRMIACEEPTRPRHLCRSMPIELETIIQKSIAKNPSDRYSTAAEMADDMHRFLEDKPIRARRPSPLDQTVKWARRHRAAVIWCFALLLTTSLVSSLSAVWLASKTDKLIKAEREKTESLWDAYLAQAHATRRSGQAGQRFDSLRTIQKATQLFPTEELPRQSLLSLRNEAIAAMALPDIKPIAGVDLHANVMMLDDGFERLAITDGKGTIRVYRIADEELISTLVSPETTPVSSLVFSSDRRHIAAKYQLHADAPARTRIWNLGEQRVVFDLVPQPRSNLEFTRDGKQICAVLSNGSLEVWDFENRVKRIAMPPTRRKPVKIKLSPDGTRVAVAYSNSPELKIRELASGRIVHRINNHTVTFAMDWHPSGRYLAVGGPDFMVRVWDFSDLSRPMTELRGHQAEVVAVSFLQNGELLATRSHDGTLRLWNALAGWQRCFAMGRFIRFDEEGKRFARRRTARTKGIDIWEVAAADEMRVLVENRVQKGPYSIDVSSDGRLMVSSGGDGVWIWDMQSGHTLQRLPLPGRSAFLHRNQLITVSEMGVLSWPLSYRDHSLQIGPPQRLLTIEVPEPVCRAAICRSNDSLAAIANWRDAVLLDIQTGRVKARFKSSGALEYVALSEDGKWIVTAGTEFQVWDARTKELVTSMNQVGGYPSCRFSPDSKYLLTSSAREFSLWETDSWRLVHRRPLGSAMRSPVSFSADGRLLALAESRFRTQLLDTKSWQRVAILESQIPRQPSGLVFTSDNSKLIVASETHEIHVWDLDLIRQQLDEFGLAWKQRPNGERIQPILNPAVSPLKTQVDLGAAWQKWREAIQVNR